MNHHKGFIAPLLLVLIAILLIGSGAYVYVQNNKQATSTTETSNSTALPVIYSISPTRIVPYGKSSGTKFTVTGKNFDYVYPSSCNPNSCKTAECLQQKCLQENHVFFKITDSNGHTLIQEDYPSLGAGDFSIIEIMPSSAWNGINSWEPVLPGQYLFSVSVDGRGTSNSVPITITGANEDIETGTLAPQSQSDTFQNLSEEQRAFALARSNALIDSNLSDIQNHARINYGDIGKLYTSFCTDPFVVNTIANIRTAIGITPTSCNASANTFAASSPLATDRTKFWCVDSTGFRGKITTPLGTSTVCLVATTSVLSRDIINSVYIKDNTELLFTDDTGKTWTVNYQNATGGMTARNGDHESLQLWLQSRKHVGDAPTVFDINGAPPGLVSIIGTLDASGILVASSIEVSGG